LFELEQVTPEGNQSYIQNMRAWLEELERFGPQVPGSEAEHVDPQNLQLAREKFLQIEREWQSFLEQSEQS
jgi:hypothetical protein